MGAEYAAPDGFHQAPLTVTDTVEILSWSTEQFEEDTELIGTVPRTSSRSTKLTPPCGTPPRTTTAG